MAEIKAFRGMRFNPSRFDNEEFARLVAPPYDVIDATEQDELYARHSNNIVRLDLNRTQASDEAENNRYTRARRHMMDWLATGVLRIDDAPVFFVHLQEFSDETGARHSRRGFVSLTRLADYEEGIVLPHERTLKGPKADRLELMKATECNLSQVFFLYEDPSGAVDRLLGEPPSGGDTLDITTPDGIRHVMWPIADDGVHAEIAQLLADKPLLIADGHHRYETALAYRDFRRSVAEEPNSEALYEYTMGFMVNIHDPGLQVFPTHRVVHGTADFDFDRLRSQLEASGHFSVRALSADLVSDAGRLQEELLQAGQHYPSFALLSSQSSTPLLVSFTGDESSPIFDDETPNEVRALDVAILHEGIIDRLLGVSKEAQEAKTNLGYIKGFEESVAAARNSYTQLVVLMNATPVDQVNRVCLSGGKMPQKSTFFYPKILSGLVINPL
ncbi:MAG: DUF1015 domain-containing protein [Bradymonadaceae bacterium]|nr:DUF1015 domain-containing protein [Lujinxingiaceae bacterium]